MTAPPPPALGLTSAPSFDGEHGPLLEPSSSPHTSASPPRPVGNVLITPELHPLSTSPLSYSLEDLAAMVGGTGRAAALWDCYRGGIDPLATTAAARAIEVAHNDNDEDPSPSRHRQPQHQLGHKALHRLRQSFRGGSLSETVARIASQSTSRDGTVKLLLELRRDGLQVEAVLIPWHNDKENRRNATCTLCVSSQVGCRQACTFCATGRMGIARSLSVDEILIQVVLAQSIIREQNMPPLENVVFMGMGEPADNADAVVTAARALIHPMQFALAPRKVTISTVAPDLTAFARLTTAMSNPVALAWSVHASRDDIRRQLVPTTRHSMVELRDALIQTLLLRSRRQRSIMLEVALLSGINDSLDDATHLGQFATAIVDQVPHAKVVINLLPWNDIGAAIGPAAQYAAPSHQRVLDFQSTLVDAGVRCYVRTTRGDDGQAACGQLATTAAKSVTATRARTSSTSA